MRDAKVTQAINIFPKVTAVPETPSTARRAQLSCFTAVALLSSRSYSAGVGTWLLCFKIA